MITAKLGPVIPYLIVAFWMTTAFVRLAMSWRLRRSIMGAAAALRRLERKGGRL